MVRRHELTDSQWESIENLLPGKASDPGRTGDDNRKFVNAVLFVLKTGIPWSDLPDRYGNHNSGNHNSGNHNSGNHNSGNHNSVWKRFDRWCSKGVWKRIFVELADEELLLEELEEVHLDSSTVKAHQVASTGRRQAGEKKAKPTNVDVWGEAAGDYPRKTTPSRGRPAN